MLRISDCRAFGVRNSRQYYCSFDFFISSMSTGAAVGNYISNVVCFIGVIDYDTVIEQFPVRSFLLEDITDNGCNEAWSIS